MRIKGFNLKRWICFHQPGKDYRKRKFGAEGIRSLVLDQLNPVCLIESQIEILCRVLEKTALKLKGVFRPGDINFQLISV